MSAIPIEVISEEDMKKMQKSKIINMNKRYIEMVEEAIREIEKIKPEDRLGYAYGIMMVVSAMAGSVNGWSKWCNLKTMNDLSEETLKVVFPKLKKLAIEWLQIDADITKEKLDDLEKEDEEIPVKKRKGGSKPTLYVA